MPARNGAIRFALGLTLLLVATLLAAALPAAAAPYWVGYEGNDFPENEGWWYIWYDIPAQRSLVDGTLVLDTRSDPHIAEYYQWPSEDILPGPGEEFVIQWRVRIDEVDGDGEPAVVIRADDGWITGFRYGDNKVTTAFTDIEIPVSNRVFHEYEMRSRDMRTYDLFIDGALTLHGDFWHGLMSPGVTFGAAGQGPSSLAAWDYVRFGVIPEPYGISAGVIGSVFGCRLLLRRRGTPYLQEEQR